MRDIDLIPIRLHKGEPTWEIIDELLEHIDSPAGVTRDEFSEKIDEAYNAGYEDGKEGGLQDGYDVGQADGYEDGHQDGYDVGREENR